MFGRARIFPRLDGYDITLSLDGADVLTIHVEKIEILSPILTAVNDKPIPALSGGEKTLRRAGKRRWFE